MCGDTTGGLAIFQIFEIFQSGPKCWIDWPSDPWSSNVEQLKLRNKVDVLISLYNWLLSPPPIFFLLLNASNSETRGPWRSSKDLSLRGSTWLPDWPRFITSDLSEIQVPPPGQCVVPLCSPDVWIDYLLLKTGETWRGRSPKSEQNKESDFTDPLSIKHPRSTIALTLLTGIPPASKGNGWGIFPRCSTRDRRRSAAAALLTQIGGY